MYVSYCTVILSVEDGDTIPIDVKSFENEWMEVEIREPLNWGLSSNNNQTSNLNNREEGVPHFLCDEIDLSYLQGDSQFDC